MLVLMTFRPGLGVLSPSPFCLKSDALLAMSGLPYMREYADVFRAPKGKFPVLRDGTRLVPDSEAIAAHLRDVHGVDPDAGLGAAELAEARAYRALVEDRLYFAALRSRWIEHAGPVRDAFFGNVPGPARRVLFALVRRKLLRDLRGQGFGRHSAGELHAMAAADIAALALRLGVGPFFFGARPRLIDTTLYGFLENLIAVELDGPNERAARSHPNLVAYCDRLRARLYPEGWV